MAPVLEGQAAGIEQLVEQRVIVGAETAPEDEVLRAPDDVDGVDLEDAEPLDQRVNVVYARIGGWRIEQPLRREHHTTRLFERQNLLRHSHLR